MFNSSINFLVYVVLAPKFRQRLQQLWAGLVAASRDRLSETKIYSITNI